MSWTIWNISNAFTVNFIPNLPRYGETFMDPINLILLKLMQFCCFVFMKEYTIFAFVGLKNPCINLFVLVVQNWQKISNLKVVYNSHQLELPIDKFATAIFFTFKHCNFVLSCVCKDLEANLIQLCIYRKMCFSLKFWENRLKFSWLLEIFELISSSFVFFTEFVQNIFQFYCNKITKHEDIRLNNYE